MQAKSQSNYLTDEWTNERTNEKISTTTTTTIYWVRDLSSTVKLNYFIFRSQIKRIAFTTDTFLGSYLFWMRVHACVHPFSLLFLSYSTMNSFPKICFCYHRAYSAAIIIGRASDASIRFDSERVRWGWTSDSQLVIVSNTLLFLHIM